MAPDLAGVRKSGESREGPRFTVDTGDKTKGNALPSGSLASLLLRLRRGQAWLLPEQSPE